MSSLEIDNLDIMVRDALTSWKKLDAVDVKILEGISNLGPRNLLQVAKKIQLPHTTVHFRLMRMLKDSMLFLHLNPDISKMGLKRAVVFMEAAFGYETNFLDYFRTNDFWVFLCPIYGRFEGCAGIWAIPQDKTKEFQSFLFHLKDIGVARNVEVLWTTSFYNISVSSRWYDENEKTWAFNWDEWVNEVEAVEGELPRILDEPEDWTLDADYMDLLIVKELEKDAKITLPEISHNLGSSLPKIKYHYYEHVMKQGLIGGYQVETYRFPFPLCEILFFKFEFDDYDKMKRFAISLLDKPIAINVGKVIGENALISHIYLPKWQLRRFIQALSTLVNKGCIKRYHYYIQDMYHTFRETIPYEHFKRNKWSYDHDSHIEGIKTLYDRVTLSNP